MFKTYVDVPRRDYIYYTVHDIITLCNNWDLVTTVYTTNHVRLYFRYKWYQYAKVQAFKKAVRNYAQHTTYYDDSAKLRNFLAQRTMSPTEKYKKALEEFAYANFIQGGIRCRDVEAITDKNGTVIGYKK